MYIVCFDFCLCACLPWVFWGKVVVELKSGRGGRVVVQWLGVQQVRWRRHMRPAQRSVPI